MVVRKRLPKRRTDLKIFQPKTVKPEHVERLWREWQKPEKPKKRLVDGYSQCGRKVWALSPTLLATVRRFGTPEQAKEYIEHSKQVEAEVMEANPKKFVLQPTQFIDVRGANILERVYPGPDCLHFRLSRRSLGSNPRYFAALKRRLERKGINLDKQAQLFEMERIVYEAFLELRELGASGIREEINTLFLDFDPKTQKVLFAIIDHAYKGSICEIASFPKPSFE